MRFAALALPLAVASFALPARGSLLFPDAIKDELGLAEVPPPAPGCKLCHRDDEGGLKNVTRPFGRTMMSFGSTAASVPAMLGALNAVEQAGADSDNDGTPDVQELRDGTDPNVAPPPIDGGPVNPAEEIPLPQTGCAISARGSGAGASCSALLLALLALRRRRARAD